MKRFVLRTNIDPMNESRLKSLLEFAMGKELKESEYIIVFEAKKGSIKRDGPDSSTMQEVKRALIVDYCIKDGNLEYIQLGYDNARGIYYAQVKGKADLRIWFFMWLTVDYEQSLRIAKEIKLN